MVILYSYTYTRLYCIVESISVSNIIAVQWKIPSQYVLLVIYQTGMSLDYICYPLVLRASDI